jgi:hypothetical protein
VHEHGEHREQERGGEELGRAEDAHLGAEGLDQREQEAADRELHGEHRHRHQQPHPVAALGDAEREEQRQAHAGIDEELEARCPLDEREVPARVLEHHRLVDHGELEVGGGIVDGDARILGERHHGEGDAGERHARVDDELAVRERVHDGGERGRVRDERRGEQHHQQRGLGEETHQHLAARAECAERGADVHAGERDEQAREREQADQGDGVRRGVQRQVGAHRGDDGGGEREAAEDHVGRAAKQRARAVREHHLLVEQLGEHPVLLQQAGRAAVLQPGPALVDPPREHRREQHGGGEHRQLRHESRNADRAHLTKSSSTSSVTKL